jgi:hypothetical protein
MVDTQYVMALTRSIEEAPASSPSVERWLDRAKELQRELSRRVVSLCGYVDELPESSYVAYADALLSALADPDFAAEKSNSGELRKRVEAFARRLDEIGQRSRADRIREVVGAKRLADDGG